MPMPDPTPAEREAFRKILINAKRFWNEQSVVKEDKAAEQLIDAIVELVKESEE